MNARSYVLHCVSSTFSFFIRGTAYGGGDGDIERIREHSSTSQTCFRDRSFFHRRNFRARSFFHSRKKLCDTIACWLMALQDLVNSYLVTLTESKGEGTLPNTLSL